MKKYIITTQRELRRAFWESGDYNKRLYNGEYLVDTRMAFVDYIDGLCRDGVISEKLAQRATLK